MRRAIAVLIAVAFLTLSCSAFACGCSTPVTPLTVFGASSLRTALDDMKATYESSHPSVRITVSTGSSAALRTQIEEGAPADVFLSADVSNPQALADAGLVDGEVVPFAANKLAIALQPDSWIRSPADLAVPGVRIVAAGPGVPITTYAEQVVVQLATLPGYPDDFAELYEANIVSREDNVGAVVAKVGLGEADAAIVYATDLPEAGVGGIGIDDVDVTATYAGVVLIDAASSSTSRDFLLWIRGGAGQQILARFGFLPAL